MQLVSLPNRWPQAVLFLQDHPPKLSQKQFWSTFKLRNCKGITLFKVHAFAQKRVGIMNDDQSTAQTDGSHMRTKKNERGKWKPALGFGEVTEAKNLNPSQRGMRHRSPETNWISEYEILFFQWHGGSRPGSLGQSNSCPWDLLTETTDSWNQSRHYL